MRWYRSPIIVLLEFYIILNRCSENTVPSQLDSRFDLMAYTINQSGCCNAQPWVWRFLSIM